MVREESPLCLERLYLFINQVRPRTEPVTAVKFTNNIGQSLAVWCGGSYVTYRDERENVVSYIFIPSNGVELVAKLGDWIVQEEEGYYCPYTQEEFDEHFEL